MTEGSPVTVNKLDRWLRPARQPGAPAGQLRRASGLPCLSWRLIAVIIAATLALAVPGCRTPAPVRLGALPAIDVLPVSLAIHKPVFVENKLSVEIVYFQTAPQLRDAMRAGRVDAVITDLGTALLVAGQEGGKIVRTALKATRTRPMYAIMASESITLEGARVAVPNGAIESYVAARLTGQAGAQRWEAVDGGSCEAGMEKLGNGEVEAALFCGDLVTYGREHGFRTLADDSESMVAPAVVVFSERMVDDKPAVVRRFLLAYEQAVRELNVRPELYHSLAASLVRDAGSATDLPLFPFPGEVPTVSDIEAVSAWLVEKGISGPVAYSRAVNGGFLWDPYQFRPASCCGW